MTYQTHFSYIIIYDVALHYNYKIKESKQLNLKNSNVFN